VLWIRTGFNADLDPAFYLNADPDSTFYVNADPDPGSQTNADPDPGLTLPLKKVTLFHKKHT
jgi:hypothetical protein